MSIAQPPAVDVSRWKFSQFCSCAAPAWLADRMSEATDNYLDFRSICDGVFGTAVLNTGARFFDCFIVRNGKQIDEQAAIAFAFVGLVTRVRIEITEGRGLPGRGLAVAFLKPTGECARCGRTVGGEEN